MSKFTQQHYEAIADSIHQTEGDLDDDTVEAIIKNLVKTFTKDNSRFKGEKFVDRALGSSSV